MSKRKDNLERVPPYIPLIWQDWESSVDCQGMSLAEEGIYFRLLRKLWIVDELPSKPNKLAQKIGVSDARTMKRWLDKYSHLLALEKKHSSECTVNLREIYGKLPVNSLETSCRCPGNLLSQKLRNLKNDVISGVALGTNQTEPNRTLTEPLLVSQSVSSLSTSTDVEENQERERPVELRLLVLSDIETAVYDLPCYNTLHESFGMVTALPEQVVREIHSAVKQLGEDAAWMKGCLHFCFDHKKFWSQRIVTAQAFADALISGLNDPSANKLPSQYNRHLATKHRTAGAGKK
jgi:hypothetical protein